PADACVHHDLDARSHCPANCACLGDVARRVLAKIAPAELHCGEAHFDVTLRFGGGLLRCCCEQRTGIRPDSVAHGTAEQRMHGLALHLARQVPQRDVDAADRVESDSAAAEV